MAADKDKEPELPTDDEAKKAEAARKNRQDGAARARAAKAAKAEAEEAERRLEGKAAGQLKPHLASSAGRTLVLVSWWLVTLGTWAAGLFLGKRRELEALTDKERDEAQKVAADFIRDYPKLAVVLGVLGFPAYMGQLAWRKVKWLPKEQEGDDGATVGTDKAA